MTINLPDDLERFIRAEVISGHFASEADAIAEAIRLLRQCGQAPSTPAQPLTEEEWERRLMNAGLLRRTPPGHRPAGRPDFQPIRIEGEPLSETVIRERR